jgi:hypothetical protein
MALQGRSRQNNGKLQKTLLELNQLSLAIPYCDTD